MEMDAGVKEAAGTKMREMLRRKSFAARWTPVQSEFLWVLSGRPDEHAHQKLLPDCCYEILELQRRNLFSGLYGVSELIKGGRVDWEKMGSLIGIGQRGLQFFEQQAERKVAEFGLNDLSESQAMELEKLLAGSEWYAEQMKALQAEEPNRPIEEIVEAKFKLLGESVKAAGPRMDAQAYEAGPEALSAFKAGIAKGVGTLFDPGGTLRGERKLKLVDTYEMLLIAWPEIDEMIKTDPPKRMEDMWNWLTPFSYAGWIEIKDLDQLVSLCRTIKLKLKKPGAPRGPRKR